jgi:site-specific DNA-methyltransferase (adenine-specific)
MNSRFTLHHGDNRELLKTFEDNSVDSIVCDPPYELGFMGKKWDSTGIAYDVSLWAECLRVLKPGGHLIAFGGTRTYHRMTVAIEDAGFEIRDSILWVYATGFPKSHDVSKAIDKQAGVERTEIIGVRHRNVKPFNDKSGWNQNSTTGTHQYTAPATPEAQHWHGWGTALKPAIEPAVLARKPLIGTVADNVLTWGVGALNIDGSRVGSEVITSETGIGRWPANIILDEESAKMIDEQSGERKGMSGGGHRKQKSNIMPSIQVDKVSEHNHLLRNDIGGASRFFYVAKASTSEREAGVGERANTHPTVKPITLMRYLIRLVTPKNGVVLDPFMGSGSTGCAAMLEGMQFVGIEINEDYIEIAQRRIEHWLNQNPMGL